MNKNEILLIGDIVVDISLKTPNNRNNKLRFGGIIHAARCLWALDIPFTVGYLAPDYLDNQIINYLHSLGCKQAFKLGNITGAPSIFLIGDVKEVGEQGYDFLLRDDLNIEYNEKSLEKIADKNFKETLVISGNFNLIKILSHLKENIHLDIANNVSSFSMLDGLRYKLSTIIVSTSSEIFKKHFTDIDSFSREFGKYAHKLILKENRGGSRMVDLQTNEIRSIPAQTRKIEHSVGVGDVYDVGYIAFYSNKGLDEALTIASWISAEYASTTFPDDFKKNVKRILKSSLPDLVKLSGVSLPWEKRKEINIYIAAPDFDFVDDHYINLLFDSLIYHNFTPRRPVKENGQMEHNASKKRRQELCIKDIALMEECSILIAVLLYNDPGTLIEVGLASGKNIPVLVYDPYLKATNCMLTELPLLVTNDLDEIMAEVFVESSRMVL